MGGRSTVANERHSPTLKAEMTVAHTDRAMVARPKNRKVETLVTARTTGNWIWTRWI